MGRSDQAGVTGTQYREELQLRGGPLGNQQVDQGCSSWQYIARGTPVNPLDESASAGLEVRYLSLVIGQEPTTSISEGSTPRITVEVRIPRFCTA